MMKAPLEFVGAQQNEEQRLESPSKEHRDTRINIIKHNLYLKQHHNTFLAYKWVLHALLRRASGATGGCQLNVADVLLFAEGEPVTWIYTNRFGCVDSRRFVATGEDSMWPRFIKTARRAAGVHKADT
jgi:hypothetical protein